MEAHAQAIAENTTTNHELVINGDHYFCPHPLDVTCGEYDNFVQWVKSLPKTVLPMAVRKRSRRNQRKWLEQADKDRNLEIACYWWGLSASLALSCDEQTKSTILVLAMEAIRDDSQHMATTLHIEDKPYHLDLKMMKRCESLADVLALCMKDESGVSMTTEQAQSIPLPIARPVLNRIATIGTAVNGEAGKIIHDKILYGK